ncbi:MAG: DegT/DnrJ/EryC1/StrS family aminotransferase [Kiritimatiellae bacterium]|nr:DegT/DnrJ/EryC1/StrS family aminotransferase [Kiritimatiellia bacterium]
MQATAAQNRKAVAELAVNGGPKVRPDPFPGRHMLGVEEKAAVAALFDAAIASGNAFGYNGAAEEAYCQAFAAFMGGGYADAVNSGSNAVYVALRALELEPFTEVIVSAITDPGGMMPIPLLNCIPVVADAAPGGYNTDPDQIAALISPLTSAIVVAHIGGEPVDIEGIMALAKKHDIPVVEDCAQAHGARLNGRLLGTFGDLAAFSTMFGKHHCTGGQGGVVFTRSEALYRKARQASDRGKPFGLPQGSTNCIASLNMNLNDLAATIGKIQLEKLPGLVERRRALVARLTAGLKELSSIRIPALLPGAEPSYWFWRLEVNEDALTCDKAAFCRALAAEGVPVNPSYRAMPHEYDWYVNRRVFGTSGLPWSAPQYKGDPNREFPCPNAIAATGVQFNLGVHESWGKREVEDALTAFRKVEKAYLKMED